jgi:hypothetical protein
MPKIEAKLRFSLIIFRLSRLDVSTGRSVSLPFSLGLFAENRTDIAPRSSGEENSFMLETFRRNPAGNQSRPVELDQQPEASLAWWVGDHPCEA